MKLLDIPLTAGMSIGVLLVCVELIMILIILVFMPRDVAGAAYASLKGKPLPVYEIPLQSGMSIGVMLICVELIIMLAILLFIPAEMAGACFLGFAIGESLGASALRRLVTQACVTDADVTATRDVTVEAYLLDFSADLYERPMTLEFVKRLRPERRFESVDALVKQIGLDVRQVRDILLTL